MAFATTTNVTSRSKGRAPVLACHPRAAKTAAFAAKIKIKHQASHNAQGGRRPGYKDIATEDVREMPGPIHPVVRIHHALADDSTAVRARSAIPR